MMGQERGQQPRIPPNPCTRDCPERSATCHGSCERYLARWNAQQASYKAADEQRKLDEVVVRGVRRAIRKLDRKTKR